MERPNMRYEILEALKEYYKDNINVLIDCLSYLKEDDEITDMGYCSECGAKLITISYREYHPEVDAYETLYDIACPVCDFINGGEEDG